ncbi:hypothetical protein M513_02741 [Trichuris suis]|uniref:Uncharacterized protein n=1 Tax=Trichuris suis TaxID=68888 RepID=A0A085MGE0_9BILA|nr:hypothetical protein M513_02741 [Trichuris suis]
MQHTHQILPIRLPAVVGVVSGPADQEPAHLEAANSPACPVLEIKSGNICSDLVRSVISKMASAPPAQRKRKLNDEGRVFQEKWEFTTVNGKIHCLICSNSIATPKELEFEKIL